MRRSHRITWLLMMRTGLVARGCASAFKRNPIPEELMDNAQLLGIKHARFLGTEPDEVLDEQLRIFVEQAAARGLNKRPARFLALSGGAADGAFGVGLLAGWTEAGDRPEFTYVTGISTGARDRAPGLPRLRLRRRAQQHLHVDAHRGRLHQESSAGLTLLDQFQPLTL
jgi:hypothetical protein